MYPRPELKGVLLAKMTPLEIYEPDELTATTTELLISVSTDSDLYVDKETLALTILDVS